MPDGTWRPVSPELLPDELVAGITGNTARTGLVRVAVDGPSCADPIGLAHRFVDPLRALGRPVVVIDARLFWRDASVRLEHGREDVESYLTWLDHGTLQREVLRRAAERGDYLPSLRDPETDRSTRATPLSVAPGTVLVVAGNLLLGLGLDFDHVVQLNVSPAARARRTPAEEAWTLPAYVEYDSSVRPTELADVVVKLDDPAHPAVRG